MGNLLYFDRVRYTLFNKNQGSLIIEEPIGWKSDEKEWSRHEQYHGIISRFSNSSKFIGSGKDFIQLVDDVEGINADIELKREEKHPKTDVWTLGYSGNLDLSTKEKENNQIAIQFNSEDLDQPLKDTQSKRLELMPAASGLNLGLLLCHSKKWTHTGLAPRQRTPAGTR